MEQLSPLAQVPVQGSPVENVIPGVGTFQDAQRRQKLASALMGMNMPKGGQMVNGVYAPPSIGQNIANAAGMYLGAQNLNNANNALKMFGK